MLHEAHKMMDQRLHLMDDPGFHFELHVVSNSSNSITSELQVTAVSELNGVIVECGGLSGTFMSAIQVASVGELISIIII